MASKRKTAPVRAAKAVPVVAVESAELLNLRGQLAALDKGFAAIECQPDGTLLAANENFQRLMGYELYELQGQRHDLLSGSADSSLWEKLGRGEQEVGRFKRLAKGGREVWLQGSYSPGELKHGIHGGEAETSVMLHLHPDLVAMEHAADFVPRSVELERGNALLTPEVVEETAI